MSMTSLDGIKASLENMLKGIERYNPDNIITLEQYVQMQAKENGYDLEANLALLKLYQFNPAAEYALRRNGIAEGTNQSPSFRL